MTNHFTELLLLKGGEVKDCLNPFKRRGRDGIISTTTGKATSEKFASPNPSPEGIFIVLMVSDQAFQFLQMIGKFLFVVPYTKFSLDMRQCHSQLGHIFTDIYRYIS